MKAAKEGMVLGAMERLSPILHPAEQLPEAPGHVLQPVALRGIPNRRAVRIVLHLLIVAPPLHGLAPELVCHKPAGQSEDSSQTPRGSSQGHAICTMAGPCMYLPLPPSRPLPLACLTALCARPHKCRFTGVPLGTCPFYHS